MQAKFYNRLENQVCSITRQSINISIIQIAFVLYSILYYTLFRPNINFKSAFLNMQTGQYIL